jgi:hypothetical protein
MLIPENKPAKKLFFLNLPQRHQGHKEILKNRETFVLFATLWDIFKRNSLI